MPFLLFFTAALTNITKTGPPIEKNTQNHIKKEKRRAVRRFFHFYAYHARLTTRAHQPDRKSVV